MVARFRYIVIAMMFGVGFAGCAGAGSQSGVDPSANGVAMQRPASVHKASVQFIWSHNKLEIPAGQTLDQATLCGAGQTAINGAYKKRSIGDDITVIASYPITNSSWQISATNNGDHQESIVTYLLCASGS